MRLLDGLCLQIAFLKVEWTSHVASFCMKIARITVKNFRCFGELTVTFDDRLTILVGKNGAGKSAILDAVTVVAGTLMSELKMKTFGIRKEDARNVCYPLGSGIDVQAQFPVSIDAEGSLGGESVQWTRVLRSAKGHTVTVDSDRFRQVSATYAKSVAEGDANLILPIISYYGTGRLWAQMREKQKAPLEKTSRLNGYLDSLDASANNKLMLQWFRKMTLRDLQNGKASPEYMAVKQVMARCFRALTGATEVDVRFNLDNLEIELQYTTPAGERLVSSLDQLSDGYKSAISLIADIAYRMSMLNPQLFDLVLEETPGVVLIDEVDLHLHPAWQHKILRDLLDFFPKVQFIVSTHAPAVIHSVPTGRLVVLEDGKVQREGIQPYGRDVNSIMREVMDVSTRPEPIKQKFADYYSRMDEEDYETAEKILDDLASDLGEDDTEVTSCRVSLQLERLP